VSVGTIFCLVMAVLFALLTAAARKNRAVALHYLTIAYVWGAAATIIASRSCP
jgi:cytochrome c biogenesis protein CcdA